MEFLKGAKDFARNPLGIVALFISLIYGFASLLLGTAAEKLISIERWPLLLFVVIFPFAVLYVFYKLVTEHHGKLYSPGDYKDDNSFLKTLSQEEKDKKLELEAKEATGDVFIGNTKPKTTDAISITKTRIAQVESHIIDLMSKELNLKPRVGVKIGTEGYNFDAVYFHSNKSVTLLEVKYYSSPKITFKTVDEFLYRAKLATKYMNTNTRFILAIVLDGDYKNFDKISDAWSHSIIDSGLNIDIRVIKGSEINA